MWMSMAPSCGRFFSSAGSMGRSSRSETTSNNVNGPRGTEPRASALNGNAATGRRTSSGFRGYLEGPQMRISCGISHGSAMDPMGNGPTERNFADRADDRLMGLLSEVVECIDSKGIAQLYILPCSCLDSA